MTIPHDDKTLRLLLRAEFAEFKVQFFQELQVKLDAKADRLPFELLQKDVAELKAGSAKRADLDSLRQRVSLMQRDEEIKAAQEKGMWFAIGKGRALVGWAVAAALAAADVVVRIFN